MSSVAFVCFLAGALICTDAATLNNKEDDLEVVVNADAKQMMRNANHPATPAHTHARQAETPAANAGDSATKAAAPVKTVNINLYYETKCPDCTNFINKTLEPFWSNKDLRPHLNITMNPYGNAMSLPLDHVSEGYKFWHPERTGKGWEYVHICQHGTDECLGNVIQACAISMTEQEKYMELIFCMAGKTTWSIEKSSYDCMASAGIDHEKVKECAESGHGNQLMADLGRKTQAVQGRLGTPWVMIDGANLQNVTDLMRTVCTHVGSGPESCSPFMPSTPKKDDRPAQEGGDGDFTVLQALKKDEFAQLSAKNI